MRRETINKVLGILAIVIGGVYLLNPTGGIIELIPDVLPVVGNLDEAGAAALVLWGIQTLRRPDQPVALPPPRG